MLRLSQTQLHRKKGLTEEDGSKAGGAKRRRADTDTLLQADEPADWPPELSEGALQGLMMPEDALLVCSPCDCPALALSQATCLLLMRFEMLVGLCHAARRQGLLSSTLGLLSVISSLSLLVPCKFVCLGRAPQILDPHATHATAGRCERPGASRCVHSWSSGTLCV